MYHHKSLSCCDCCIHNMKLIFFSAGGTRRSLTHKQHESCGSPSSFQRQKSGEKKYHELISQFLMNINLCFSTCSSPISYDDELGGRIQITSNKNWNHIWTYIFCVNFSFHWTWLSTLVFFLLPIRLLSLFFFLHTTDPASYSTCAAFCIIFFFFSHSPSSVQFDDESNFITREHLKIAELKWSATLLRKHWP